MTSGPKHAEAFFAYARARHGIYLRRRRGLPREEWTDDPIFKKYRFTNCFRELDKTTVWFRKNVRDHLRDRPEVLLATVVFRMLNRIETGEAIFCQWEITQDDRSRTAWEQFLEDNKTSHLRRAIKLMCGAGPYVTGAYILTSPPGYAKLDGMLRVIGGFARGRRTWEGLGAGVKDTMNWGGEEGAAAMMLANRGEVTLEACWRWLRQFEFFGDFHSYEIVTDLRHTALLDHAPDIMTWANPGPGCNRGANRVHGRPRDQRNSKEQLCEEMRQLLEMSQSEKFWPQPTGPARNWPAWEMRDVEHTLCEFDKYERVRLGEGRPRGVFQ